MAFPTTAILDQFNRANESPMAGNWTGFDTDGGTSGDFPILTSNQVTDPTGVVNSNAYWNAATFGQTQEAYLSLPVLPAAGVESVSLVVRLSDDANYYAVEMIPIAGSNNDILRFNQRVADVETQIGTDLSMGTDMVAGDQMGILISGEVITVYRNGTSVGSRSMTGSLTGTRIGFRCYGNTSPATLRIDSFGGGDAIASVITLMGAQCM